MNDKTLDLLKRQAESQPIVGYFGYGSLVNEKTLRTKYIASIPSTLTGWKRTWDAPVGYDFGGQNISILTARPDANKQIQGVIVFDLAENLPQVDKREHNYDRHKLDLASLNAPIDLDQLPCDFYVYEAQMAANAPEAPSPILHSYLDAVLQGFLKIYGQAGIEKFVHETEKFHTPILQDRLAPQYPRSVDLEDNERDLIDYILSQRSDISFIR